jgi:hypothetical protein
LTTSTRTSPDGTSRTESPTRRGFLAAAHELDVPPERAVVTEDATAGVQAAKAGQMGAIGIARRDDAELLAAAGADIIVKTPDEVDVDALVDGRLAIAVAPDKLRRSPTLAPCSAGGSARPVTPPA